LSVTRLGRRSNLVLVAVQVALGFVLVAAGALTVSGLSRAWSSDSGYDRARIVLVEAFLKRPAADDSAALRELADRLGQVPGVDAVSATNIRMFGPAGVPWSEVTTRGRSDQVTGTASRDVDANFFRVTTLRIIDGAVPAAADWRRGAPVAVVSETAAKLLWPGQRAVGLVLAPTGRRADEPVSERRVAAVVADARYMAADRDPVGDIYLPGPIGYGGSFLVRTTRPAALLVPSLRAAAEARGYRVDRAVTLTDALFLTVKPRALTAWFFGLIGTVGLAILGAGVLGLVAMTTAQRTREMGIRCALGATAGRVVRDLVGEQAAAVVAGLMTGAVVSAWAVRGIESQLYGVRAHDAGVWSEFALIVVGVSVVAIVIPAWRVANTDPVLALKVE
jgi:hypothetical protein